MIDESANMHDSDDEESPFPSYEADDPVFNSFVAACVSEHYSGQRVTELKLSPELIMVVLEASSILRSKWLEGLGEDSEDIRRHFAEINAEYALRIYEKIHKEKLLAVPMGPETVSLILKVADEVAEEHLIDCIRSFEQDEPPLGEIE